MPLQGRVIIYPLHRGSVQPAFVDEVLYSVLLSRMHYQSWWASRRPSGRAAAICRRVMEEALSAGEVWIFWPFRRRSMYGAPLEAHT